VRFVKRAKTMQIIVGVSAPGFATMRSLALKSMDAGAAGVMIAPPPHLRTDDQISGYFKQAQEAIGDDIPWVLQDYPLTLTVVFTPAVIRKIVMDSPSCVMLKHEDWPGLEKISALRAFATSNNPVPASRCANTCCRSAASSRHRPSASRAPPSPPRRRPRSITSCRASRGSTSAPTCSRKPARRSSYSIPHGEERVFARLEP